MVYLYMLIEKISGRKNDLCKNNTIVFGHLKIYSITHKSGNMDNNNSKQGSKQNFK